jgi:hypothetical protein
MVRRQTKVNFSLIVSLALNQKYLFYSDFQNVDIKLTSDMRSFARARKIFSCDLK